MAVDDPIDAHYPDGRIAPVARLAKLFFDAIESGGTAAPDFAEGFRVQQLIDAAQRSHRDGADRRAPQAAWRPHEREPHPGHRRLRLHRLGAGEGAGRARVTACACSTTIRAGAPRRLADVANDIEFIAGDIRDAAAVDEGGTGHGRGASSRLRQRHRILLQRAGPGARCRRARHDQCDRCLPRSTMSARWCWRPRRRSIKRRRTSRPTKARRSSCPTCSIRAIPMAPAS